MRSNRRRHWFIKRIALGLAIAAFAAPVAEARVDEGVPGQPNAANESFKPIPYRWPSSVDAVALKGIAYRTFFKDSPSSAATSWTDPGIVATPSDYQAFATDFPSSAQVALEQPRSISEPRIEFIRTHPRPIGEPQVVSAGLDWTDAGIGVGLALALVLLAGGAALTTRHARREQTA
jgi:hypothetical protein